MSNASESPGMPVTLEAAGSSPGALYNGNFKGALFSDAESTSAGQRWRPHRHDLNGSRGEALFALD